MQIFNRTASWKIKSVTVNLCQQRLTESCLPDNNKYFLFEIPNIIITSALRLLGRFSADQNHTEAAGVWFN